MKVTWLGQSGFLFESGGKRLLIDPFFSDIVAIKQGLKRLVQLPISIEELFPDYILITHNHLDHFDPIALPQIHQQYPNAFIIGPKSVVDHALQLEFNPNVIQLLEKGGSILLAPFFIKVTPAYHSDPFSIGVVIETENKGFYISGDTILTENLVDGVKQQIQLPLAAVFIIINGKLGNMNVNEAVEVVAQLKPNLAIPMHYGMFAENTEDPNLFLNACYDQNIKAIALEVGITTNV